METHFNNQGKGFGTGDRPAAVGNWFRLDRRRLDKSPRMPPEGEFRDGWWLWWGGLQPSWRSVDVRGRPLDPGVGDGPWDALQKPGSNGVMIILLSLVWWWEIATVATMDDLRAAIDDVTWVLSRMVESLQESEVGSASRYGNILFAPAVLLTFQ